MSQRENRITSLLRYRDWRVDASEGFGLLVDCERWNRVELARCVIAHRQSIHVDSGLGVGVIDGGCGVVAGTYGAQPKLPDEGNDGDIETAVDAASPPRVASAPATAREARISVSGVVVDDLGDAVADASVDLFIANGATLGSSVSSAGGTIAVEGPLPAMVRQLRCGG